MKTIRITRRARGEEDEEAAEEEEKRKLVELEASVAAKQTEEAQEISMKACNDIKDEVIDDDNPEGFLM